MDESPVRTFSYPQTPPLNDDVSIAPAMLKWITTRPPPFSETAAVLVKERMNVLKIKGWLVNNETTTTPPPTKAQSSTPSFGDDDDFEIDFDMLEALEKKIPIQDTPLTPPFIRCWKIRLGRIMKVLHHLFMFLLIKKIYHSPHEDPIQQYISVASSSSSPSSSQRISPPLITRQQSPLQRSSSQLQQPVVESPQQQEKVSSSPDRFMQTTPIHDDVSDKLYHLHLYEEPCFMIK
ncbi:hypothetical protein LRAMOSA05322 [Lichtheimia ramosa]|uniref:Uncharacterized protein n=1 Tax=Lichtheimia ramosa TaxID=688394 RepID=A0A077X0X4_9FUNG|nr:hypothetical protein LRAMOSA05322 [Lichtheimia ramosa]